MCDKITSEKQFYELFEQYNSCPKIINEIVKYLFIPSGNLRESYYDSFLDVINVNYQAQEGVNLRFNPITLLINQREEIIDDLIKIYWDDTLVYASGGKTNV